MSYSFLGGGEIKKTNHSPILIHPPTVRSIFRDALKLFIHNVGDFVIPKSFCQSMAKILKPD